MEEEKRRREERESWRREDEARREASLARVTDSRAAVTWRELLITLPLALALLLAVYYGSAPLHDWADPRPAPESLEGLGIPGEGGEPDPRLISIVRSVVGWALSDWLVLHRFAAGLLCSLGLGGVWWLHKVLTRRRTASIEEDEYVGVYSRNDDGTILWR